MSDPAESLDAADGARRKAGLKENHGVPRWVKLFGLAAAVLLVLAIVVVLVSGGRHGPGRHLSTLGVVTPSSHTGALEQPRTGELA